MRRLIVVAFFISACGAPSAEQIAWCADNVDSVHAAFVRDVYGEGATTIPAAATEVGQRMAAYFASGGEPPAGMNDNEQGLVDNACADAYGRR